MAGQLHGSPQSKRVAIKVVPARLLGADDFLVQFHSPWRSSTSSWRGRSSLARAETTLQEVRVVPQRTRIRPFPPPHLAAGIERRRARTSVYGQRRLFVIEDGLLRGLAVERLGAPTMDPEGTPPSGPRRRTAQRHTHPGP